MTPAKPALVCLMGPTASGKTELAIALAAELDCELVSVDSALVYRGLDIGSAKPDYPHHLVDICDPAEAYSAARFCEDANPGGRDRCPRPHPPAGRGNNAVFQGLSGGSRRYARGGPGDSRTNRAGGGGTGLAAYAPAARGGRSGSGGAYSPAAFAAPGSSAGGLSGDRYYVVGLPRRVNQRDGGVIRDLYRVIQLAICPADRAQLHRRIEQRFSLMLEAGLLQEVRHSSARGDLHPDLPAVRAVGYRQVWQYLDGTLHLEEARDRAIAATRQLAKRQLTWLRKWPEIEWILTDHAGNVAKNDQLSPDCRGVEHPAGAALQAIGDVRA